MRKRESYSSYSWYYYRVILDKYFFMLHKELLIEIHDALRKAPAFALSKCAKRRTTGKERCERAYPLNVNVARTCSKHFKDEDIDHTCPQKRKFGIQRKTFLKNEAIPSRNLQTRWELKTQSKCFLLSGIVGSSVIDMVSYWKASAKIICFCFNIYHMSLSMPNSVESIELNSVLISWIFLSNYFQHARHTV